MMFLFAPLLAGVVLAGGLVMLGAWFVKQNPATLVTRLKSAGGWAMIAVGALLIARGQVLLGVGLISAGLSRAGIGGGFGGFGHPGSQRRSAGQASKVRTARIEATLDHDTGEMDAEVLAGRHEGKFFSAMTDSEIADVWRDCAADDESRLIVEAYLDRQRPGWRESMDADFGPGAGGAESSGGAHTGAAMTEEDAYEVLGLQKGASEAEVRAAHRRLMKQMHPDQGGSTFLAAKLNEAKDLLLRRR